MGSLNTSGVCQWGSGFYTCATAGLSAEQSCGCVKAEPERVIDEPGKQVWRWAMDRVALHATPSQPFRLPGWKNDKTHRPVRLCFLK